MSYREEDPSNQEMPSLDSEPETPAAFHQHLDVEPEPRSPVEYKIIHGENGQVYVIAGRHDERGIEGTLEPDPGSTLHQHQLPGNELDPEDQDEDNRMEEVEIPESGVDEEEHGHGLEDSEEILVEQEHLGLGEDGGGLDPLNNYESYDQTIEEVIRTAAESITDEELAELQERKEQLKLLPKPKPARDPLALPFQYAGQSFNVQSQKLILNVAHFLKEHKKDDLIESVKTPQEKAARLLNISSSVIGKIRKSWKTGKLEQPGKMRKMTKRVLDKVDSQQEDKIKEIIRGLYEKK
jgi:hypothetical protein